MNNNKNFKKANKQQTKKEINNKLAVTRGDGGGEGKEGKHHQGTYIKDTWTKPKGVGLRVGDGGKWGGRKWWWENGDNCIQTIIE